jgi:hypothetical protein
MKKGNVLLAGMSILLFASTTLNVVFFLIAGPRLLVSIPSPAVEAAGSLMQAIVDGDTETINGHLCNKSEAHQRFVAAELAEVQDIVAEALGVSLREVTWEDSYERVQIGVYLERPVRIYDKSVSAVMYFRPDKSGLCNEMFFFDRASWNADSELHGDTP